MKLRWKKVLFLNGSQDWEAYSGEILVGSVCTRLDGSIGYTIKGVYVKWITRGYGDVASVASGKRAVNRAWAKWLQAAGLLS